MASPRELEALLAKAMHAHQSGQLAEAQKSYRAVLKNVPAHAPTLHFLGLSYFQQGKPERGLEFIEKALAFKPDYAEAHYNLANALQGLGRFDQASRHYSRALAIDPNNPNAYNNLGAILHQEKRYDEAIAQFDRALALDRNSAQLHNNMGAALKELQRYADAITHFHRALELDSANPEVGCNLGMAALQMGRYETALAAFDQTLTVNRGLAEAWLGRGQALEALRRHDEAAAAYDKVLELNPLLEWAQGYRFFVKMLNCDWRNFSADSSRLIGDVQKNEPVTTPFVLLLTRSSPADQQACAKLAIARRHPASPNPLWRGERYAHDRIRIAYISADFREHAVARVMAGLFEQHDRTRFEVSAISLGADDGGAMRSRLVKAFDRFEDVFGKSDREIASLIREREIDIAVDLMGFTQNGRIDVMAMRPAPLQVSYLGWSATMGASYIDYILGDEVIIPRDQQPFYTEKIAFLPHSFMVADSKRHIPETTVSRRQAGLPDTGFVFCSFNNSYKYTPDVFDVWMRLLREVEGSVLWLLEGTASSADNLRREAQSRGVGPERLVFAPRVGPDEHLARHRLADLFIDTSPYNAHTTTSDALWTGLPVLTCPGAVFAGRVAASLLAAAGLSELIAPSLADYEALALRLACDPALLASLRSKLANNRATVPLFDTARSARDIETAFTTMWERQQGGLPPATFHV